MRRRPVGGKSAIACLATGQRSGGGEEASIPPHHHIDLDAAQARIVERVAHMGERHVARSGGKARRVVVLQEIVVDGLGHVKAAQLIPGGGRLLAHDAAGVGGIVAADIEEIADVVGAAASEDLLAIGLVRLVAGRAQRGGWRVGYALEPVAFDSGQVNQPVGAALDQATHAMAHAEDALHLAGGGETCAQSLDDASERLIDDGGRASRLADHRIAGEKIRHCSLPFARRGECPRPCRLAR
jgi:hypothetical protein